MSGGGGRPFPFLFSALLSRPPRGTGSLWFPGFLRSQGGWRGGEAPPGGQAVRAAFVNRAPQPFLKPACDRRF